jgi:hypothetical protein
MTITAIAIDYRRKPASPLYPIAIFHSSSLRLEPLKTAFGFIKLKVQGFEENARFVLAKHGDNQRQLLIRLEREFIGGYSSKEVIAPVGGSRVKKVGAWRNSRFLRSITFSRLDMSVCSPSAPNGQIVRLNVVELPHRNVDSARVDNKLCNLLDSFFETFTSC